MPEQLFQQLLPSIGAASLSLRHTSTARTLEMKEIEDPVGTHESCSRQTDPVRRSIKVESAGSRRQEVSGRSQRPTPRFCYCVAGATQRARQQLSRTKK